MAINAEPGLDDFGQPIVALTGEFGKSIEVLTLERATALAAQIQDAIIRAHVCHETR